MTRNSLKFLFKLSITIAAIAYLISSQRLQLSQLRIAPSGWNWLLVAGLIVLVQMIVMQLRLWLLLRAGGVGVAAGRVVRIGLVSWFINASLLGGLGFLSADAVRAAYLMQESKKRSAIVGIVLLDRAVGIAGLVTLVGLSLLAGQSTYGDASSVVPSQLIHFSLVLIGFAVILVIVAQTMGRVVAGAVAAGMFVVLVSAAYGDIQRHAGLAAVGLLLVAGAAAAIFFVRASTLSRMAERWPRIGAAIAELLTTIGAYRWRGGALVAAYLSALAAHSLSVLAIFLLAGAITIDIAPTLGQVLFAAPITFLTAILPLPASGLGVGEIAFDTLLRVSQGPGPDVLAGGAALYLAYRVVAMITALAGLPFYLTMGNSIAGTRAE